MAVASDSPTPTGKKAEALAPRWADIRGVAEYADVNRATVRDWIKKSLLPAYHLGPKIIRVDLNDVDAMMRPVVPVADGRDE